MKSWNSSDTGHFDRSRPFVLKQWFANATFSRVHVRRSVLTFVFERTLFRLVESVWSTSDSSRADASVADCVADGPMIWLSCGDVSRSHRTLYVLFRLTW